MPTTLVALILQNRRYPHFNPKHSDPSRSASLSPSQCDPIFACALTHPAAAHSAHWPLHVGHLPRTASGSAVRRLVLHISFIPDVLCPGQANPIRIDNRHHGEMFWTTDGGWLRLLSLRRRWPDISTWRVGSCPPYHPLVCFSVFFRFFSIDMQWRRMGRRRAGT